MGQMESISAEQLYMGLEVYERNYYRLPGIEGEVSRSVLVRRLIESLKRIEGIRALGDRDHPSVACNPTSERFNPLRAAAQHRRGGNSEEAFWLVFLAVHFGRNHRTGWRLLRDVYAQLGRGSTWDWQAVSSDPVAFRVWLDNNQEVLRGGDGIARHFGNHRKYQSLNAWKPNGTGDAVQSYIDWVLPYGSQRRLFEQALSVKQHNRGKAFDFLFSTMNVRTFGRTARFDFLSLVGHLGLAAIEPPHPYLENATGPLTGARLLYTGSKQSPVAGVVLQRMLVILGNHLGVGMQVLEDAFCNWQKSPERFYPFEEPENDAE